MKQFTHISFILIFLIIASEVSAQAPVVPEKQKLIGELVAVMKMDRQFPEMVDSMLKEMEKTFPLGFNAAIDANTTLTAEQKSALKATSGERYAAFSQKFRKRMSERIDYGKYIKESVYPLYDKFYTEQDLKDLIAFYKTPTGQKLINTLPALLEESNKMATEKFLPMILPLVEELMKEELDQIGSPAKKPEDRSETGFLR